MIYAIKIFCDHTLTFCRMVPW